MYLFQLECKIEELTREVIYIPLCIYFNLAFQPTVLLCSRFTFHYVSISTGISSIVTGSIIYLHSTMYLFQHEELSDEINSHLFTFHYVSISTNLIAMVIEVFTGFTFHYVSISTKVLNNVGSLINKFTFHYVSISTADDAIRA